MAEFSKPITELIRRYQEAFALARQKESVPAIHVDEIASRVATFYEKIRGIVDWKEEHLIRRGAIERILKRKLISELPGFDLLSGLNPEKISESLVLELIRGGHVPNDFVPKTRIKDVYRILAKYIYILEANIKANSNTKAKVNFYNWLLDIAACEIEEILDPPFKQSALIIAMTELMEKRIVLDPKDLLTEQEARIQLYIGVHQTLFHLDSPIISYHLLRYYITDWGNPSEERLEKISSQMLAYWGKIEKDLDNPLSNQFYKICERLDTLYLVLADVLNNFEKEPAKIPGQLSQIKTLQKLAAESYYKRFATLKKRLYRMAIYSTLSIFLAGGMSLFIVEVPLASLLYGRFSFLSVVVDMLFPTILMFALVASSKLPSKNNLAVVLDELYKIVYDIRVDEIYEINKPIKKGFLSSFIMTFLYSLVMFTSLIATAFVFYIAKVPISSVVLDTLNVAIVVFAALIIRRRAKELTVEREKPNVWQFSLDIMSVPVAKVGKWFSRKWQEYNLASVLFIALVDMPFQTFISFIESWSTFLKERKAEIH